jgi:Ca2+-binding EF-hand superfamily protein
MGPISEIYFSMDLNADGLIQPTEVQSFFNILDANNSGKIKRKEFIRATDATLMEVCLESAKLK